MPPERIHEERPEMRCDLSCFPHVSPYPDPTEWKAYHPFPFVDPSSRINFNGLYETMYRIENKARTIAPLRWFDNRLSFWNTDRNLATMLQDATQVLEEIDRIESFAGIVAELDTGLSARKTAIDRWTRGQRRQLYASLYETLLKYPVGAFEAIKPDSVLAPFKEQLMYLYGEAVAWQQKQGPGADKKQTEIDRIARSVDHPIAAFRTAFEQIRVRLPDGRTASNLETTTYLARHYAAPEEKAPIGRSQYRQYQEIAPVACQMLEQVTAARINRAALDGKSPLTRSLNSLHFTQEEYDGLRTVLHGYKDLYSHAHRLKCEAWGVPVNTRYVEPLVPTPNMTLEVALAIVEYAMERISPQWGKIIRQAIEEGWIDVRVTQRRSQRVFMEKPYGLHPFVLARWSGDLWSLEHLAHELGHAIHYAIAPLRLLTADTLNPVVKEAFSQFVKKLALREYFTNNVPPDQANRLELQERSFQVRKIFGYLLFDEFEREVYGLADQNGSFTPKRLSDLYMNVARRLGSHLAAPFDPPIDLNWIDMGVYFSRKPFFYTRYWLAEVVALFLEDQYDQASQQGTAADFTDHLLAILKTTAPQSPFASLQATFGCGGMEELCTSAMTLLRNSLHPAEAS